MATINVTQNTQRLSKKGEAPLALSFYVGRDKIQLPCKISIDPKKFDANKGAVKGSTKEANDMNLIIERMKARVNEILVKSRLRDIVLNKESFMREYNNPSDFVSFHAFVAQYMKFYSKRLELSTFAHHRGVMSKLKVYCENLQFHELTEDFLRNYTHYLKHTLHNADTTINKNLTTIKVYVTAALKKGYMKTDPFSELKIKRLKSKVDYLTEQELTQMIELYNNRTLPERLQRSLTFFLFMCFTSLHISDARSLIMDQFGSGVLMYYRIKNRNVKPEAIRIPMTEPALKIFNEMAEDRIEGRLFLNLQCDQVINRHLKEIARLLAIEKDISAKTGRHTFATIFLRKTKDIAALQKLLGHSSIRETMIYGHVMDESLHEGMLCFNSFKF